MVFLNLRMGKIEEWVGTVDPIDQGFCPAAFPGHSDQRQLSVHLCV